MDLVQYDVNINLRDIERHLLMSFANLKMLSLFLTTIISKHRLKAHTFSGMLYIYKGVAKHLALVEALPEGSNSTHLNVLY